MHTLQKKILDNVDQINKVGATYRKIGQVIGEDHPQSVKHHVLQLEKKGFIEYDSFHSLIKRADKSTTDREPIVSIPVMGSANCGPASFYADDRITEFLKVSQTLLNPEAKRRLKDVIALKASGDSMNKADIAGKNIENQDYVLVDREDNNIQTSQRANKYFVSIINGMANIKRVQLDSANGYAVLASESTGSYPDIIIDQGDDFLIAGRVLQVIKKPQLLRT